MSSNPLSDHTHLDPTTETDRADNYPDYLDDALGYAWDTWDNIAESQRVKHDHILHQGEKAFPMEPLHSNEPIDLFRLALARYYWRRGDINASTKQLSDILDSEVQHPSVRYDEVYELIARRIIYHSKKIDEKFLQTLIIRVIRDDARNDWSKKQPHYRAIYHYLEGTPFEESIQPYLEEAQPEAAFEILEDLFAIGKHKHLEAALDRLFGSIDQTVPRDPLCVDIEVLRKRLTDCIDGEK